MKRHFLNGQLINRATLLNGLILCLLGLAFPDASSSPKEKIRWQTGRLVAANLSGHGTRGDPRRRTEGRGDIWWVYCVSSDAKAYSAVSRVGPDKAGLAVDRPVQFTADRNRIVIRNTRGERFTMRIVRQGDESVCR